jgi:hypothetical protein
VVTSTPSSFARRLISFLAAFQSPCFDAASTAAGCS